MVTQIMIDLCYDRSLIMKEPNNETKNLKFPIKFLYIEYLIQLHTSQTKKVHKIKFKTDILFDLILSLLNKSCLVKIDI